MRVQDFMNRNTVTVSSQSSIGYASRFFNVHGFRHYPVVDAQDKKQVVGLLTDRDLFTAPGNTPGKTSTKEKKAGTSGKKKAKATPTVVDSLMRTAVSVAPLDSGMAAAWRMIEMRAGALLVTDGGTLKGIATPTDFMRAFVQVCRARKPAAHEDPAVKVCMAREAPSAHPDDRLEDVLGLFYESGLRHMPVVADGKLEGMIAERELRQALEPDAESGDQGGTGATRAPRSTGVITRASKTKVATVSTVMSTKTTTIGSRTTLSGAADEMLRNHLSAVPVVRNGEYLGLVTQATVVGHCAIIPMLVPRQVNGEVLGLLP